VNNNTVWVIIGLVFSTFLVAVFAIFFGLSLVKYKKIAKAARENGQVYTNKPIFWTLVGLASGAGLFYLIALVLGIVALVRDTHSVTMSGLQISFEIFFLILALILLAFLIVYLIFESSLVIGIINGTLFTMTNMLKTDNILQVRTDNSRHHIFINWNKLGPTDKNSKNIAELKLRYNYKIKDFFKENNLWDKGKI